MTAFLFVSLLLGLLSFFYAYLLGWGSRRPGAFYQAFARLTWPGLILGSLCLLWSARHACIMLEGDLQRFHIYVKLLVPFTIVASYFLLDYLNARALGAFMILAANHLLHAAFVAELPARGFYSIVCLALGVAGLFLLGSPWRMRQTMQLAAKNPRWGMGLAAVFVVCAASLVIQPFL